jgi:glyoxylate/hydroxypyruvate reductase A
MFIGREFFRLNIFVCTGPQSKKYETALETEIKQQRLKYRILNKLSEQKNANFVIYSDDCEIADLSIFPSSSYIFSTFAGVEKTLQNGTITQPIVRMIDDDMSISMAEWCVAHVMRYHLDIDRFINTSSTDWITTHEEPPLAHQKSIGILGLGTLGQITAKKLQKLGFFVRGWSSSLKNIEGVESLTGKIGFEKILKNSDYLILLLPLTSKTENIINKNSIQIFKEGTKLINAARGGLIDEESLIEALEKGKISACTLDVFNEEPLPRFHRFWSNKKITITPHISAPTRIKSSVKAILANIKRIELGKKPKGLVERKRSY